ncbi:MAG: carbamate kinase [Acidimicrobiales bacterium]|jgi:carbamate kinase|nr:carbamate kinase [Acidimicrobiales bacterium]
MSPVAVVAFGGNALVTDAEHDSIPQQYETVSRTVPPLVDMVERGWGVVVSHGNGPQVGFILRRSELAEHEVDPVPVDYAVADTQGAIGYMFVKALRNELAARGLSRPVVAVVTQSVVDLDDPAFAHPTKPVGSFMDEATARALAEANGWTIMQDAGRGWRRTVASPRPQAVVETEVIRDLLASGALVVAVGGGGIPVAQSTDGRLTGVEAVVDKDLASGLLAHDLGADLLMIPTGVRQVAIRFGEPDQQWLDVLTVDEARAYVAAGEFGEGSMEPKVAAVADFVAATPGAVGVIGAAEEIPAILDGRSGTRIVRADDGTAPAEPGGAPAGTEPQDAAGVLLAVNGTLMRGLKLNPNMVAAGASFVRDASTQPVYRLWSVDDDHPAMVRVTDGSGAAVALEVWSVPAEGLAGILQKEPPGLSIGKVSLHDGTTVLGVLGEPALVEGKREITHYAGWRAYVEAEGIAS